jgi:hypothetical protein
MFGKWPVAGVRSAHFLVGFAHIPLGKFRSDFSSFLSNHINLSYIIRYCRSMKYVINIETLVIEAKNICM